MFGRKNRSRRVDPTFDLDTRLARISQDYYGISPNENALGLLNRYLADAELNESGWIEFATHARRRAKAARGHVAIGAHLISHFGIWRSFLYQEPSQAQRDEMFQIFDEIFVLARGSAATLGLDDSKLGGSASSRNDFGEFGLS